MTQTSVLLFVSVGSVASGAAKSWFGDSPSMMNQRLKTRSPSVLPRKFSFSQRWVLITGILPSVSLYRPPLCQRCPVCDMHVFVCGYPPSTPFTRHPRPPPLCEDSCASLSDLSDNSGSWNRHTDIGTVQQARQLGLLWKPWLYTHSHTQTHTHACLCLHPICR